MGFKEKMLERIEQNSIKINVNGEKVYLKKSGMIKDWHVIYPPINPETRKINWANLIFGGKANAIKATIVFVIVVLFALGAYEMVSSYNNTFANSAVQACLKSSGVILGG